WVTLTESERAPAYVSPRIAHAVTITDSFTVCLQPGLPQEGHDQPGHLPEDLPVSFPRRTNSRKEEATDRRIVLATLWISRSTAPSIRGKRTSRIPKLRRNRRADSTAVCPSRSTTARRASSTTSPSRPSVSS